MPTQLAYSVDHAAPFPPAVMARNPWTKAPGGRLERDGGLGMTGPVLHFAQDREIYSEGADADLFFKVVSGVVRTCKFLSDGRRQIDAFYKAGDVFGFEFDGLHGFSAEAVCDCTLISYRRRGLEALAASDQGLMNQLFSYAMQSLARAQEHALLLGRRSATEKVAAFLIDGVDEFDGRQNRQSGDDAARHRRLSRVDDRDSVADPVAIGARCSHRNPGRAPDSPQESGRP